MMRNLKIIGIVLAVFILLIFIGIFVLVKTFDISKYKSRITQTLSQAVGRSVTLEAPSLTMSLTQGVALNVQNFQIADDPQFSATPFFRVAEMRLHVDILSFLKTRGIVISTIYVKAPQLHLVRTADGRLNVPLAGTPVKAESPSPVSSGEHQVTPPSPTVPAPAAPAPVVDQLPQLSIRSLKIDDAQIVFLDKARTPEMAVEINDINFHIDNFSLTDPFNFGLTASVFSAENNFKLSGKSQLDLKNLFVRLDDVKFETDLSQISVEVLKKSIPAIEPVGLGKELKGTLSALVSQMVVGPKGLMLLAMEGGLRDGEVSVAAISIPVTGIQARYVFSDNDAEISSVSMQLGTGMVSGKAKVFGYLKEQRYTADLKVERLPLEPFVSAVLPDVKFQGKLNVRAAVTGHGFQSDTIVKNLEAQSQMNVEDGQLTNMNALTVVLQHIPILPGLVGALLEQNLPEPYRTVFTRENTVFQRIALDVKAEKGKAVVDKAEFVADMFSLTGAGSFEWDKDLVTAEASIRVFPELSEAMVSHAEELSGLLEEDGRLRIPLRRYEGKLASFKMLPDMEYLGKTIVKTKGAREIKKLLDNVFDREDAPSTQETEPLSGEQGTNQEKSSEEKIIENVFDSIFN